MKLLRVIVLSLSSLIFLPLLVVKSSSISDNIMSNITRGSSFSSNDTSPYWLSPSGNIAFGFYLLPCTHSSPNCSDQYVVGIWFVKSLQKTLVWTTNSNDLGILHKPFSILLTEEGRLVLRIIPDNKDKLLLPDVPEPAAYAVMHDNGNFVLYGSDSQIVWESFDYPTDTILGGQTLRPGIDLISCNYRLLVKQTNGYVAIYKRKFEDTDFDLRHDDRITVLSDVLGKSLSRRSVVLSLDITGKLYLASSVDDQVVKVIYEQDERKQQVKEEGEYIYRATLSSLGHFDLNKERIDGSHSKNENFSSMVWPTYRKPPSAWEILIMLVSALMFYGLIGVALKLCCGVNVRFHNKDFLSFEKDGTGGWCCGAKIVPNEKDETEGDLDLGRNL